jgi:molecular chaperone DnaK
MKRTIDYGIDLGTTNSCIAILETGAVRVFQNNDQMNVTPSAIHILKTGRVIVGRRARAALLADPDNVSVEFKRWMGQRDRKEFIAANRVLSAEELSAEILKSLREDVRRQTGTDVTAAVITVPAAFGTLQCEATARAAGLAGIDEAPLLQEPIAAAIGYGIRADSANQRWLVFDLGGGTLDIAVISTKDGRLSVIEHRGNNLLGGKDIDRLIVDQILLPAISQEYNLHDANNLSGRSSLLPRLRAKAEEAKIDLSVEQQVVVSVYDIGEDDSGEPIEMDVSFTRSQLQSLMEPMLEKCLSLAAEALAGARIAGSDLDRILLVGGPTQSPIFRTELSDRIGAPVDFSVDPMTVVARGAAVYASSFERSKRSAQVTETVSQNAIALKLAYDPVSSMQNTKVAGRVLSSNTRAEIKIDSASGLWTSGWIRPQNDIFEVTAPLQVGEITTFWVYARNQSGQLLDVDTPEFKIRHGLVPSAPPLPHTLSIEILQREGKSALDPVFPKGSPLPLEKTVKYRATHTLSPSNPDSDITIKLWEGEFFAQPDANEWVGKVIMPHDGVRRPIPEGAEIEVTIQVDSSRRITVTAFVPHLNQHFSDELYRPEREEQHFVELSDKAVADTSAYRERLEELERKVGDAATQSELRQIRREIDEIESSSSKSEEKQDPDSARRIVESSKAVLGKLSRIEQQAGKDSSASLSVQFIETIESAEEVVNSYGSALEKQQFTLLKRELDRAVSKDDNKGVKRAVDEIEGLHWRVLFRHDWFWREIFDTLAIPGQRYVDQTKAQYLIAQGHASIAEGDGKALQEIVRGLWKLQPQNASDEIRERASRSGLRKY